MGEPLMFKIDERNRQVDHELTEEEKARQRRGQWIHPPRWDYVPTGELRIHLLHADSTYVHHTWKDTARRKLEDHVNPILLGFFDEALKIKAKREERRQEELRARREEEKRLRLSQRRSTNAKLVTELEAQAGAWMRAKILRSYLRALSRATEGKKFEVMVDRSAVDLVEWAQRYVDQLDPLSSEPHDPDLMDESLMRFGPREDGVQDCLSRLLGRHWQKSLKVKDPQPLEEDGID